MAYLFYTISFFFLVVATGKLLQVSSMLPPSVS